MDHRRLAARAAMLAMTLLAGCASPWAVDSYQAPEGDLTGRDGFFIKGGEIGTPTTVEPGLEQQLHADVREAIRSELGRKGYTEAPGSASARLVVSYQVSALRKFVAVRDERVGAPSPTTVLSPSEMQPPPLSTMPREQNVRATSVIVFVEDPAGGRLLWRGVINADTRVGSPQEGVRILADMARHVTQQMPPRGGQAPK